MKDLWKASWQEWLAIALIPLGILVLLLGLRFSVPRIGNPPGWELLPYLIPGMLMILAGLLGLTWYTGKRTEERHKILAARTAESDAFLRRLKTTYPPDPDVLFHLHKLGYANIGRYVSELQTALEWVAKNYKATLAGKPVRDADECLSEADRLTRK